MRDHEQGQRWAARGRPRASSVAVVSVLLATLIGCGSPTNPSGSTTPGSAGPGATGAGTAPGATNGVVGSIQLALVASVTEIAANENALAAEVAHAAGLPAALGPDTWAWADDLLHDELAKAGQTLSLTGDAALVASLEGGPPRTAVDGGVGLGLAMAAALITSGISGSASMPSINGTQTTTANGETTTGTVTGHISVSVSGSSVEGDVDFGVQITVVDAATGAAIRDGQFRSRGKMTLDLCPDVNGKVKGHVTASISGGTSSAGSASVDVEVDVEGTVGDDATLNGLVVAGTSTQSTTPAGGGPARTLNTTGNYRAPITRGHSINIAATTGGAVVTGPMDMTQAEADAAANQIGSAAGAAFWVLADHAQGKWRSGACVEIRSTNPGGAVRKNQLVQFEAKVFHKIEGIELNKPIVNTFSGKKSVDPVDVPVPAPVTVSFKAGSIVDDVGTIEMTTTSNRGIGTLTVEFKVEGGWIIDQASGGGRVRGLKCGDPTGRWVVDGTYSKGGFDGVQKWTVTINADEATGTFIYHVTQDSTPPGSPVKIYLDGDANGRATLSIDPVNGMAYMVLTETKHTYNTWTLEGGHGNDRNAPLETYNLDWDVGGTC